MTSETADRQAGSAAPTPGAAILHRHSGDVLYEVDAPTLRGAVLTGARYDADTRWPEGFTPHAYGAVAVRSRTAARRQTPVPAPPATGEVLIVEDDDTIQSVLACRLRRAGFRVVTARNGREA